jgi:hypothetical protein
MSRSWSREEVEATIADYFHMLTLELSGQQYNKTEHRRALLQKLNDRTSGAIELKHQNISAILLELGYPWIPGYKPMKNYQALLFDVIADRLTHDSKLDRTALAAVEMPAAAPLISSFENLVVEPPERSHSVREPNAATYAWESKTAVKRDYFNREAQNSSLGLAGEEFVLEYERWRLAKAGHKDLAEKIEHVSKTRGDGLGFDVRSFDTNGKDRLIEVKTTSFGKEAPFFLSRYELEFSRTRPDCFHLYRVFQFRKQPRLFSFKGPVDTHCHLDPLTFQGKFS